MKVDYCTFEYDDNWFGEITIKDDNTEKNIDVEIVGGDDSNIPEDGKQALEFFLDNYKKYKEVLLEKIVDYYDLLKVNWGPDEERFPDLKESKDIYEMITLIGIRIRDQERYGKYSIALYFDCTWDMEEGMGIDMTEFKVTKIGVQGEAF